MKKDNLDINLNGAPNDNYIKFFKKFEDAKSLEPKQWNATHVLGYFIDKYENHYKSKYKFKFNTSAPSKCFEVFQIKKLSSILSSDPIILKEYIDWVFDAKVIKARRKLTSISFMTSEGVVGEYKMNYFLSDKKKIDRSTPLPENIKAVFKEIGFNLSNYGELSFLSQMTDMPESLIMAFKAIEFNGINKEFLGKIV